MDDVERPLKDLVKGAGIYIIGFIIAKFFNYFYRLIIARTGSEQYGILSLGWSFISVLAVFATLSFNISILRYIPYYKAKNDNSRVRGVMLFVTKMTLFMGLLLGFLLFVFSDWFSLNFFPNINLVKLSLVFKFMSLAIPLTALNFIFNSVFESFKKIKYEVITRNILEPSSKLFLSGILVYYGIGVVGFSVVYVISVALSFILGLYFLEKKVYPFLRSKIAPIYVNKELMVYSWPLIINGIFFVILGSVDTWLLGSLKNASDVGVYNVAYPTGQLILTIPQIILILFIPIITELYAKEERSLFNSIYQITTKWLVIAMLLPLGLIFLFSKPLIGILFTSEYTSGYLALIILSSGFFIYGLSRTSENMLMIFKKTKIIMLNYTIATLLSVFLNLALIPKYGINGAAFATAFSYSLVSLFILIESYIYTKVGFFKFNYLKIFIAMGLNLGIVMAVIHFFVENTNIYIIIALSLLSSILYFLLLLVMKVFSKEDIMIIDSVMNKLGYNIFRMFKFLRRYSKE